LPDYKKIKGILIRETKMSCILAQKDKLVKEDLEFETVQSFVDSDHFDLYLCKCKECGQFYIGCFVEITTTDFDDDHWNFWVPVDDNEVKQIGLDTKMMIDLIQNRRHIRWHPNGDIYWAKIPEIALAI
jgi:hypothetical protein